MRRFFFALMTGCLTVANAVGEPEGRSRSVTELEHRLRLIDLELGKLAETSLNSGVGPIGYRSKSYDDPDHIEWVEVDLGKVGPVEEVVLVPSLWRSTKKGFVADAFPEAFRILIGTGADRAGTVVAEYPATRDMLPRIEPLVIPTPGERGSWVRVEAIRLSPRSFDGKYTFQLSELLVFSGEVNRALRQPVATSPDPGIAHVWGPKFLVDGVLPYVMNAAQGEQSLAFTSGQGIGGQPSIMIDLREEQRVSGVRLHATDQSDTVPQAYAGDFGLPRRFRVEVASEADFSDARTLLEAELTSLNEMGPIMEWPLQETPGRHFRLTALEPFLFPASESKEGTVIGFAEIEVLAEGRNVAVGMPATASFPHPDDTERSLASLTDGRNLYGMILPLRRWLGELSRRHDLETERPIVASELSSYYIAQKANLRRMIWLAVALAAATIFLIVYYRVRERRKELMIRERIAANLHDNLGANLHAIGLLGDLAKDAVDNRDELVDTLDRIRGLTERTGSAARDCANMLEAEHVCEDLLVEMRRDSTSLLADLEHQFSCKGEEFVRRLKRRKRIDLYLFYKEALANVIRHSGATSVETDLVADASEICLTVTDNGLGLNGQDPVSLKRRARLLGADLRADEPDSGGTRIELKLKSSKLDFLI